MKKLAMFIMMASAVGLIVGPAVKDRMFPKPITFSQKDKEEMERKSQELAARITDWPIMKIDITK